MTVSVSEYEMPHAPLGGFRTGRLAIMILAEILFEAVKVAEDLINRFPKTQVAKQLRSRLSNLKRKSDLSR
jgi:hypothetical protein